MQDGNPLSAPARAPEVPPQTDGERRSALVIVNPYATGVSIRVHEMVLSALSTRYEVDIVQTQARDHATELAHDAAERGFDLVIAVGGDGTVNEAANGLVGSETALACLPGGATNVFCQMLGIPADLVDATQHMLAVADRYQPRRVDLGHVGGRFFTFSSGVGVDASVVQRIDSNPKLKARFGAWYATYAGFAEFAARYALRPPRITTELDGAPGPTGVTILVQNGDPYTYFGTRPLPVAEGGGLNTGTLAGAMLTSARPTVAPGIAWRLLSPTANVSGHRAVAPFTGVTELIVRCDRPVQIHVDGDHIGEVTEARYGVRPDALLVVA
jgi:diacylglycerol kinase family enzyme